MDCGGVDGWCVQRCAGGAHDKNITMNMNRMMLRFRPIAPKPASGGAADSNNLESSKGRRKRKYVRVRRNSGYRRSKKDQENRIEKKIVTLQLLPERLDRKEPFWCSFDGTVRTEVGIGIGIGVVDPPTWLNCESRTDAEICKTIDRTEEEGGGVVESLVTVECVTDTCMDVLLRAGESTDVEILKKDLESDTCPALISDGWNRVVWVNGAYRRMVRQESESELRVGLVVKEKVPSRGFSCRVRVQYCMKMDQWSQMVVPCDVWEMNGGGFAWRLDTEAALRLGR